jgi:hypothetical protein
MGMGRPKKKEINLTESSILALMQEIYNELVEQRNTAIRIQNKMLTMMKEPEDMTLIGPVIEKQQKIINDCVEKKLSLSKLQSTIWGKSIENKGGEVTLNDIDMDDEMLKALLEKDTSLGQGGSPYKM